ncbi:FadR/GntR family transcriptional regulator [Ornithinimicrobium tianjinense]|uniref:GntR family transcriptional regulator n=1 Tax=Ornithinimicrobium tianjinense TaxID=1195761 RepID=A0A917BI16_9MICO|nr:FadR/GntR family transcriptional regulator [Ornithinimicrobium tianjinense]GGF40871.1 GntR family transcriptional regulator [Ornithinimicrobium tianjinense]
MTSPPSRPAAPARLQRSRLYEQIVEELVAHMRTHGLGPGDRLPPERELAQALGVSRASVAQALVALEVVGVIQVRHGEGAIVRRPVDPGAALVDAVRVHQDALPDIIDARSALEAKLAYLAAERRTEDDMQAIDDALALMERQVAAGERGLEGDRAFHEAVTRAGHSAVLARLMTEIGELILETRIESLSQPGRPQESLAKHRAIAEAIRQGRPADAALAMTDHIDLVSDVALLRERREEDDR